MGNKPHRIIPKISLGVLRWTLLALLMSEATAGLVEVGALIPPAWVDAEVLIDFGMEILWLAEKKHDAFLVVYNPVFLCTLYLKKTWKVETC